MSRIDTLLSQTEKELCEVPKETKIICKDNCRCCPLDILPEIETNCGTEGINANDQVKH